MADEVIVLTGIKETQDALKQFDKAAARKFNKVINDALTSAERSADNLVVQFTNPVYGTPMRGWRKTSAANPRTRGGAGWRPFRGGGGVGASGRATGAGPPARSAS